jgi:phosphotriesterase-related protein
MSKSAVTVTGLIPEESLGLTLPHEHVLIDFTCRYRAAADETDVVLPSLSERWRVLREPAGYRANLDGTSVAVATTEVDAFKASGGSTIVDLSVIGLGSDPRGLVEVVEATGVNIIAGTGTYVTDSVGDELRNASVEELETRFVDEIENGGAEGIRRGVIGEIGIEAQTEFEVRAVVAAARAQARTGAPCYLHVLSGIIASSRPSVLELVDRYVTEGGDPARLVLCHQDGSGDDIEYQKSILDRGAWLEYDTFGFESVFGLGDDYIQLPTDSQRIRELKRLIDEGYQDQLLISHDICYQMMRRSWGGWGYAHLLDVLPGRFRAAGIDSETLQRLMVHNPARLLCFVDSNGAA